MNCFGDDEVSMLNIEICFSYDFFFNCLKRRQNKVSLVKVFFGENCCLYQLNQIIFNIQTSS